VAEVHFIGWALESFKVSEFQGELEAPIFGAIIGMNEVMQLPHPPRFSEGGRCSGSPLFVGLPDQRF
jgi:hypothetical protein